MGALPQQSVEIERQGCDEGLALARFHFGDAALMQDDAADELHVIVAQADGADRSFAHESERLRQDVFHARAAAQLRFEIGGGGFHLLRAELLHPRLKRVDPVHRFLIAGQRLFHRVAQYFSDDVAEHEPSRIG